MVHVQNATLAGGVAIGAIADLFIQPYGSLLVGGFAGILSTAGYAYITVNPSFFFLLCTRTWSNTVVLS